MDSLQPTMKSHDAHRKWRGQGSLIPDSRVFQSLVPTDSTPDMRESGFSLDWTSDKEQGHMKEAKEGEGEKKTSLGVSLCATDGAGPFTFVISFKEMK